MKTLACLIPVFAVALVLSSCTTIQPPPELDAEDFEYAAGKALTSLINSGCLNKPQGGRYVVAISRVTNNTTMELDTDMLIKKIRVGLLNSGKVVVTTAVAHLGPEDAMSKNARQLANDDDFNQATVAKKGQMIAPDLSISGKIISSTPRGTARTDYYFQLSLTQISTGLAIWEGEERITKMPVE